MSIREDWPEFVTPEAIARNTGVWPIGYPKPRLRWQHCIDQWIVKRTDEPDSTPVLLWDRHPPESESELLRLFQ